MGSSCRRDSKDIGDIRDTIQGEVGAIGEGFKRYTHTSALNQHTLYALKQALYNLGNLSTLMKLW